MKKKELLIILILAVLVTVLSCYLHLDILFWFLVLAGSWLILKIMLRICKVTEKRVPLVIISLAFLVTLFSGHGLYKLDVQIWPTYFGLWRKPSGIPLPYLKEPCTVEFCYEAESSSFWFILDCLFWSVIFIAGYWVLKFVLKKVKKGTRKSRKI